MTRCGRRRTCRHAEPCRDYLAHVRAAAIGAGQPVYLLATVYGWALVYAIPDQSHYAVHPSGRVDGFLYRHTNAGRVIERWAVIP